MQAGASVLVDANLLLVWVVGTVDRTLIARFKRTRAYNADDFDLLVEVIASFRDIVVTPHVLTEVSNLAGHLVAEQRDAAFGVLAQLATSVTELGEPSAAVVTDPRFIRLGLTDAAVARVAQRGVTVLTADLDLYLALAATRVGAINFNHLRVGG